MIIRTKKSEKKYKNFISSNGEAWVHAKTFIELDSKKIRHIEFYLKIIQEADKTFYMMIHLTMPDFSKTFFVTLKEQLARHWMTLCHPDVPYVEFSIGVESIMTRALSDLITKPQDPIYTVIKYDSNCRKADAAILLLMNHFIETKARVKKFVGRTFVNLKTLTEAEIILHSLFVIIKEDYRELEDIVCKLVITGNNLSEDGDILASFKKRRQMNEDLPRVYETQLAYDIIQTKDEPNHHGTFRSLNIMQTKMLGYQKLMNSVDLSEANLNPSGILRSHLYRLDMAKIEDMLQLLLSTASMIDQNYIFFTQVCRVFSTYFIFSMKIKPPESFETIRVNNSRPSDLPISGFWSDNLRIELIIYNVTLHKFEESPRFLLLRDLIADFEMTCIEGFYRSIVCGGMNLTMHMRIKSKIDRLLSVEKNTLALHSFFPEDLPRTEGSQGMPMRATESGNIYNGPYMLIDPYKRQAEAQYSGRSRMPNEDVIHARTSRRELPSAYANEERLLPWGTCYKRLQIMTGQNKVFYSMLKLRGCLMKIRMVYHGKTNQEEIHLSACNLETHEVYKIIIKDQTTVERLVNLIMWQKEVMDFCHQYLKVSTNLFMDIRKDLAGRNLFINNVYQDRTSIVRQETIEQTKWNVFCQLETLFLNNFFMKKVLYFATTHKILGKVYVTCKLYYSFKLSKNQLIVLLVISPVRKRFTSHQIILNSLDLSRYFNANIFEIVHNDQDLVKLFSSVISKLVLYKSRLYSQVAVPVCWIRRLSSVTYTELLQNEFDQRQLYGKKATTPVETYLTPKIYSKEVIVKVIHRFNRQYWILTVTKNLLLDRIDIEGYVPSTRRKFQCRMTAYDIELLSAKTKTDFNKLTPYEISLLVEYCQSYQLFDELVRDKRKRDTIFKSKLGKLNFAKVVSSSQASHAKSPLSQAGLVSSNEKIIEQMSSKNYSKVKFWIDILSHSKLILKHNDLLIEMHSFRGVLQEHLWSSVCVQSNLKYEICVDLEAESGTSVTSSNVKMFTPIHMDSLSNYAFLLKVIFIEADQQIHVDKVILDSLVKIYGLLLQEKITKFSKSIVLEDDEELPANDQQPDLMSTSKLRHKSASLAATKQRQAASSFKLRLLRLADLIELCRILEVNIMDNIQANYLAVIDNELAYFNNERILSREIIYKEKFERRMKLNSRLCLDIMSDPHYKDYNDILLCRTVFTIRPLQTLAVLYNKKRKLGMTRDREFSFHIYDNMNCNVKTFVKSFEEITYHIPYALILLDNMKFAEISKRLVALYKNSLLTTDFIQRSQVTAARA